MPEGCVRGDHTASSYGLIAVYYQSRLMNEEKQLYLSHSLPLGYRYPLGNCKP